jgi:hypothetical protein
MSRPSYIPREQLVKIAEEAGCILTDKTTCIMVTKGKNKDNRLYIAKTRDVARINVNGFKCPDTNLTAPPKDGPVGTFLQVVRFDHPVPTVLANFRTLCENLDSYKSEPKKARGRPAGFRRSKNKPMAGPVVEVQAEETPKQHMERLVGELAKKKELAAKIGFPLSPKTIKDFEIKIEDLRKVVEA